MVQNIIHNLIGIFRASGLRYYGKLSSCFLFYGGVFILLLSSCGACDNYYHSNSSYNYESFIVLADTTDTIASIQYDAKEGLFYPDKYYFPLLISYAIPTWATITTAKGKFRICVSMDKKFTYLPDTKCGNSGSDVVLDPPKVDSILGGTAVFRRGSYIQKYYGQTLVDSLYLRP